MAEYTIYIKNQTQQKTQKAIANENGEKEDTSPQKEGGKKENVGVKTYISFKRVVAPFVSSALNHQISTVTLRTGRVEEQQKLQFAYDIGSKVANAAENVVIGALTGGGVGAVVGLATSAVQTGVNLIMKVDTINKQRSLENVSIGLLNARAGGDITSYNGSR